MPPANNPPGRAEDLTLILQAIACPAFRFGHLSYGGHGLRWLAAGKNRTQPRRHAASPPQHGEPGTRP
jgi:hypothetical protein